MKQNMFKFMGYEETVLTEIFFGSLRNLGKFKVDIVRKQFKKLAKISKGRKL